MASYTWLHFARKTASLSSSLFNISQQRVCSFLPFWLSLPCRNVSSAASELPPSLLSSPLLMLPPEKVVIANSNQRWFNIPLFNLADNQVVKLRNRILPEEISDAHCTGSSHGWLAYVNGPKCGIYLANFFSPFSPEIIELPTIETLPTIKGVDWDSSSNIVKKYSMNGIPRTPHHLEQLLITRFTMSSAPNNGNNNCTVMISNGGSKHLAFCRIGDTSWTTLKNRQIKEWECCVDLVYSKKDQLFYALTESGQLQAWDLRDPTSPKAILIEAEYQLPRLSKSETDLRDLCYVYEHLVELPGGDILYVDRYIGFVGEDGTCMDTCGYKREDIPWPYRTTRFDIFKAEFEKKKLEYVTSIGDNAMFLGNNHSFSLSTRDYPHLKPNSIYFTDYGQECMISEFIFDYKHHPYGGHDVGVYSLEDHSVTPLYHPFEFKKIIPPPIWVFPGRD